MKKVIKTLIFMSFLFVITQQDLHATEIKALHFQEENVSIQNATQAYLTPSRLNGRTNTSYTLTVSTNVSGSVSFTFDPGITGVNPRTEPGSGSRNFSQEWTTRSLTTFTTGARVTSRDYGPSHWTYGTATIRY
ncbi:hypothetical protein J2T56_000292 [Natronobacillus azotifigens]|uniref:Uncharacterized protein n=1 Tax=Natronobacillus azotifigens TaxID=472978 RepID=A0A9J6R9I2_9BACI|nr:hypothetical protein [Natronobacillus azotifigens]MCZ0701932.1 hypothetical protein [Natronobacillus azotifigens]